ALIYPVVLATVCVLVVSALLVFVVPIFDAMFERLRDKGQLPAATEFLLSMSSWITSNWWWLLALLAILLVVARVQVMTDAGRTWLDRWRLKAPLFGSIFRNLAVSRFCRVLGTLLKNGVPILKSLDISRAAAGNRVLSGAIGQATENITAGESLSVPLSKSGHFPRNVIEMIAVAEESNTMDTVLINIADGLERETTRRLELVVKMIEPGMLIVMAGVVLFLVMALLMPIVKMSSAIQ
ncbi:MAG TPA: type II secretion system F family protein, partial [Pirellulaceae bacterium]|nr:type II secretion system F family protein [Pirellulaceae bacterium]